MLLPRNPNPRTLNGICYRPPAFLAEVDLQLVAKPGLFPLIVTVTVKVEGVLVA